MSLDAITLHRLGYNVTIRFSIGSFHHQFVVHHDMDFDGQYDYHKELTLRSVPPKRLISHISERIIECSHPHLPKNGFKNALTEDLALTSQSGNTTQKTAVKTSIRRSLRLLWKKVGMLF